MTTRESCGSSPGHGKISVYSKELTPLWGPSIKESGVKLTNHLQPALRYTSSLPQDLVVCTGTSFLPRQRPVEVNGKLKILIHESYLLRGTRWRREVAVRFSMDSFRFFIDYGICGGFGGLGVSVLASGSNPAEVVGFFWRKNPQHAFLRRGSKAVGPMYFASCKRSQNGVEVVISAKFTGQYSRP